MNNGTQVDKEKFETLNDTLAPIHMPKIEFLTVPLNDGFGKYSALPALSFKFSLGDFSFLVSFCLQHTCIALYFL